MVFISFFLSMRLSASAMPLSESIAPTPSRQKKPLPVPPSSKHDLDVLSYCRNLNRPFCPGMCHTFNAISLVRDLPLGFSMGRADSTISSSSPFALPAGIDPPPPATNPRPLALGRILHRFGTISFSSPSFPGLSRDKLSHL